jgi:hypothetical protein
MNRFKVWLIKKLGGIVPGDGIPLEGTGEEGDVVKVILRGTGPKGHAYTFDAGFHSVDIDKCYRHWFTQAPMTLFSVLRVRVESLKRPKYSADGTVVFHTIGTIQYRKLEEIARDLEKLSFK